MNKREKVLLIATGLVVSLILVYLFVLEPMMQQSEVADEAGSGDLVQARETFANNVKVLSESKSIRQEYQAIAFGMPVQKPGEDPGETFSTELYNLLTTKFNVKPDMNAPRSSEIENVQEYEFVEIRVQNLIGTHEELIKLLAEMEQVGLLIKSFRLEQQGQQEANPKVKMEITVARLVKREAAGKGKHNRFKRGR